MEPGRGPFILKKKNVLDCLYTQTTESTKTPMIPADRGLPFVSPAKEGSRDR
jgi:hypothetical protein